jgi:hypothetical protein
MRSRRRKNKLVVVAVPAGILASAAYAFTAANTVPATQVGSGQERIDNLEVVAVE